MGKITGFEDDQDIPSKVMMMYMAVEQLIGEGVDMKDIRVSTITERAGIGKGTAYDYFDSKEDILACAVIFYIKKNTTEFKNVLRKQGSFVKQVELILQEIEKGSENQQCIMRSIHMMTDTSNLGRLVQDKLHMMEMRQYLPTGLYASILEEGKERGEIRNDLPMDYMVYTLFSKILSYMLCFCDDSFMKIEPQKNRQLVYLSILKELSEKNV